MMSPFFVPAIPLTQDISGDGSNQEANHNSSKRKINHCFDHSLTFLS